MKIRSNIPALNANRHTGRNNKTVSKALEKLSSGFKITVAADDASGLAISEKMRAQIVGLSTASSNCQDGISLIQTAEGALAETHAMLNRLIELATQSANGTIDNEVDRKSLQMEVASLKEEIDRIASSSHFNGIKLLDGSLGGGSKTTSTAGKDAVMEFQPIPNLETTFGISDVNAKGVTGDINFSVAEVMAPPVFAIGNIAGMTGATFTYGAAVVEKNTLDGWKIVVDYTTGAHSIGSIDKEITLGIDPSLFSITTAADFELAIQTQLKKAATLALVDSDLAKAIAGLTFANPAGAAGYVKPSTGDPPVTFQFGVSGDPSYEVTATDDTGAVIGKTTVPAGTTAGDLFKVTGTGGKEVSFKIADMDQFKSRKGLPAAVIGKNTEKTPASPGTTEVKFSKNLKAGITFTLTVDGVAQVFEFVKQGEAAKEDGATAVEIGDNIQDSLEALKAALQADPAAVGYAVTLKASDGAAENDTIVIENKSVTDNTPALQATVAGGGLSLQIGDTADQRVSVTISDMSTAGLGLTDLDISLQDDAVKAIDTVKKAINIVSSQRADLGAIQNRLEYTITNLGSTHENMTAAESRIRDADMAKEMMTYTKSSVLTQAAQAMLAQANQLPQGALQLLQ